MESTERIITSIPSNTIVSLVCPKGIEASLLSLNSTIVGLNIYGIKSLMGILLNNLFIKAEKKNIEEKLW